MSDSTGRPSVADGHPDDVEPVERHSLGALDVGPRSVVGRVDRQVANPHDVGCLLVGDELAHPGEGHRGLFATSEDPPDHPWQEAQPAQVGREQCEGAEVEASRGDRPRG